MRAAARWSLQVLESALQDLACATEIAKILNFSLIRCLLASIMALECMGLCTTAMSGTYELLRARRAGRRKQFASTIGFDGLSRWGPEINCVDALRRIPGVETLHLARGSDASAGARVRGRPAVTCGGRAAPKGTGP